MEELGAPEGTRAPLEGQDMRHALLFASIAVAVGAAVACSDSKSNVVEDVTDGGPEGGGAVLPPSSNGDAPTGPAGSGLLTGLPCDVQAVLENRCIACHDGKAQFALLDYDDLVAPSKTDPTKNMAQMSLERMKNAQAPMPPPPAEPPEADEIQTFEDWVKAGWPKGALCTDPPPDGGVGDGGVPEGGADGGDGGVVCTSGTMWTGGNSPSPLMNPGEACNACHQQMGGPNYRAAGTVYPTLHEPDDCNGKGPPPQLTVVITDAMNRVINVPVNAAGNFFTRTRIAVPYKAAVTDGTRTRAMVGSVTSGDCNSCHTVQGTRGAPGRVLAP